MSTEDQFKKWDLDERNLRNLTPIKVRDLIIECFYTAQAGTFKKVKEMSKLEFKEKDILTSIVASVRLGFAEADGDFDNPTKEVLAKVVDFLAAKAASWGTPKDLIEHHKSQINKAISLLR